MKRVNLYKVMLLLLLAIMCISKIRGQANNNSFITHDFNGYYFNPRNIGLSTPQSADFIKYGNLNVNHYNGLLDMSIELDGYKDRDFDLPMSLKYVSSGFIPSKRPSIVGYNWFLNFGGSITRTIKGTPDDTKGNSSKEPRMYLKDGLLVAIRDGRFKRYSTQQIEKFQMDIVSKGKFYSLGDFKYDFEPDIFNFSFGNHSGSFIIGNDGTPVCLSGNGYKIDIGGLSVQEYSTTATPVSSTIKITTPDGYIYEFGGNTSYLEYFFPNNPVKMKQMPRHIISWYLKSIEAPSHRKLQFEYKSQKMLNCYNYFLYTRRFIHSEANCSSNSLSTFSNSFFDEKEQILVKDNVFSPVISRMTTDNGLEIKFETAVGKSFYETNDYSIYISDIIYLYNSEEIKRTSLNYMFKGKYLFLNNLFKNGEKYSFEYNLFHELPPPLTTSTDHWGFWNGEYSTKVDDVEEYCRNLIYNKNTLLPYWDVGLLHKVIYPTGGETNIGYLPNSYNRYLTRNLDKYQIDLDTTANDVYCGGARVYSLNDYDPITKKGSRRTFQYKIPQTGMNSGVIGFRPKYSAVEFINQTTSNLDCYAGGYVHNHILYEDISSNSLGINENLQEYYIGYSDVVESFSDSSSVHYHYSSNADISNSVEGITGRVTSIPVAGIGSSYSESKALEIAEKTGQYITNDLSQFRGKMLTKTLYDASGHQSQKELYTYNIGQAREKYNTSANSTSRGWDSYRIYLTPCLLQKKEVIDSNHNVHSESYLYNDNSIIAEEKTLNSNGNELAIRYKYASDYSYAALGNGEKSLVDRNILRKPLSITKVKRLNNQSDKILESLKFSYRLENNQPVLSTVKKFDGFNWINTLEYPLYDVLGNPIYTIENGYLHTVYLWGYKGQHLISKIINASYSDVQTAAQKANLNINNFTSDVEPSIADLNKLNTLRDFIPKAQITTYTHTPLFGVSKMYDPRYISTYYAYNKRGKLVRIMDSHFTGVKQYYYNLSTLQPLTANLSGSEIYAKGHSYLFNVSVNNGSGNYKYQWTLKDRYGSVCFRDTTTAPVDSILFKQTGKMSLECKVLDVFTREQVSCQLVFTVVSTPSFTIEFSDVAHFNGGISKSNVIEGFINCSIETVVNFHLHCFDYGSTPIQGSLRIQSSSTSASLFYPLSGYDDKSFRKRLPAGRTYVRIELNTLTYQSNNSFCITSAEGCSVGANSCLHIY